MERHERPAARHAVPRGAACNTRDAALWRQRSHAPASQRSGSPRNQTYKEPAREPVAPTEELRSKACDDDCISRRTSAMPSAHRCTLLTLRQICKEIRHGVRARAPREQDSACASEGGSRAEQEQRATSVCGAGPMQECSLLLPEPLLTLTKAQLQSKYLLVDTGKDGWKARCGGGLQRL